MATRKENDFDKRQKRIMGLTMIMTTTMIMTMVLDYKTEREYSATAGLFLFICGGGLCSWC